MDEKKLSRNTPLSLTVLSAKAAADCHHHGVARAHEKLMKEVLPKTLLEMVIDQVQFSLRECELLYDERLPRLRIYCFRRQLEQVLWPSEERRTDKETLTSRPYLQRDAQRAILNTRVSGKYFSALRYQCIMYERK
jgi:hypothetical protein